MKKIYSFLVLIIFSFSLKAQWAQLKSENLNGFAEMNGLVYSGTSVFLATSGGVFRSTDNGVTWNLSVNGLDETSLDVSKIVFISSRNELWISSKGGIFQSTNDGVSWTKPEMIGLPANGWSDQIGRIGDKLVIKFNNWSDNKTYLYYSDEVLTGSRGL